MNKVLRLLLLIASVSFGVTITSSQLATGKNYEPWAKRMLSHYKILLDLTDKQTTEVQQIFNDLESKVGPLWNQFRTERDKLKDMVEKGEKAEKAEDIQNELKKIWEIKSKISELYRQAIIQIIPHLTQKQIRKAIELELYPTSMFPRE
jgi:Spy/CpxP family protein refolding chaperone